LTLSHKRPVSHHEHFGPAAVCAMNNHAQRAFLRATACNAIAHLCYGRGVRLSHCCIVSKRRN